MGCHKNIRSDKYPTQSNDVGRTVRVFFHYDTSNPYFGIIIRDDKEEPYKTIFELDDGRVVLSTECQYSMG